MLTSWKCEFCDSSNDMVNNTQCCKCHKNQTQLSPIGEIMHNQKLLFDGFMRIKLLSNLSKEALKIMTEDVVNLCSKFYTLHIVSIMEKCRKKVLRTFEGSWIRDGVEPDILKILSYLSDELIENKEYFIAYKTLKILLKYEDDKGIWDEYHRLLGKILYAWGMQTDDIDIKNESLSEFEKAVELEPDNVMYRAKVIVALKSLGKWKLAIAQYEKELGKVDDKDEKAAILNHIADCYKELKENESAEIYYEKAISYKSDNAGFHRDLAEFSGNVLKNYEKSSYHYEIAIELEPDASYYYYRYAVMLRDGAMDYEKSEKYYLKCLSLKIEGQDDYIHGSYGYLLYLMGKYEKAMKNIQNQLDLLDGTDSFSYAYFYAALVNKMIGNDEKSEDALSKAVECTQTKSDAQK